MITGILNLLLSQEGFVQYPSLNQMASKATVQVSNSKHSLVTCTAWVYGKSFNTKGYLFSDVGTKTLEPEPHTFPMMRFPNTEKLFKPIDDLENMIHYGRQIHLQSFSGHTI